LENRDTNESRPVDEAFCNRTHGPPHRGQDEWPYPGFDPTGRRLASIFRGELHVLDVANVELSCRLHR
ncbi:hypothetical protein, partial [Escherichia coli]|uniref:hypothetical protein n=1 Tax=Escherichia coli TaxID=562 RepID=UPI00159B9A53